MMEERLIYFDEKLKAWKSDPVVSWGITQAVEEILAEVRNLGEHVERLQKEVAFWREKCENG